MTRKFWIIAAIVVATVAPNGAQVVKIDVSRTVQAVTYRPGVRTEIDFRGTELMPRAEGEARITTDPGITAIDAKFEGMDPPSTKGPYLTYVLWALSPDGRAINLGELKLDREKAETSTTTRLTAFALIVTAEPYFAVTMPSETVVFENLPRKDTKGTAEPVKPQTELFARGQYANLKPQTLDPKAKIPSELYQARAAADVAKGAMADQYAGETWTKARGLLDTAEAYQISKKGSERKQVAGIARQAVQASEDARSVAVRRASEAKLEAERKAAAAKEAEAKAATEAEAARRAEAERNARDAEMRAADAQQQAASATKDKAAADAARQKAMADADAARKSGAALRAQLLSQFNQILPTEDTPRGLVVNLGGVNFASGKADLNASAREKLARFSGLVAGYPALKVDIEGHTDSTGKPEFNEKLSQDRASSVREYLVKQGVRAESVTAKGLGPSAPIASNDTSEGRAQNRRVEIIVSGEVIGTKIGS